MTEVKSVAVTSLSVSIIGTVVTVAAVYVAVISFQADRQRDFEGQRAACLASIREEASLSDDLIGISLLELADNDVALDTAFKSYGRMADACVVPGLLETNSELGLAMSERGGWLLSVPLATLPRSEADDAVRDWLHLLDEAEAYVLELPDVPMIPWEGRATPEATHTPRDE